MIKMTLGQAARILGLNPLPTMATIAEDSSRLVLSTGMQDLLTTHTAFATEGQPETNFTGISIDTRTLLPGNLFIALSGSKVDGHDFIEAAKKAGASCALVSRKIKADLPQLVVDDTALALGQLAAAWRNQFTIPFIAVTGSNGKTTLKNMLASILSSACSGNYDEVLFSQGNLNNHLGLPLTLANLHITHRYAVIEMGMNHFGEIEYLTKMTRPNVAIITNAGSAHLEGLGSLEGVAKAKSEIFLGMQQDGMAILNRDDAFFPFWREQIGNHQYLTFGFHPDADISVVKNAEPQIQPGNTSQFVEFRTPIGSIDVNLSLLGRHNVMNALAAIAGTLAIGIDLQAIRHGLEHVKPAPGRLQIHHLPNDVRIIDDTYNANPFSLKAAIATLCHFSGKKILVLADMKELGTDAIELHQEVGQTMQRMGIDYVFTYGELSMHTSAAFGEGAFHFTEKEKLISALKPFLHSQTTILVKGSRSMRMEQVVAELIA